jgi:hypothetical protein
VVGAPLVGGYSPLQRITLPRSDTAYRISFAICVDAGPADGHTRGERSGSKLASNAFEILAPLKAPHATFLCEVHRYGMGRLAACLTAI